MQLDRTLPYSLDMRLIIIIIQNQNKSLYITKIIRSLIKFINIVKERRTRLYTSIMARMSCTGGGARYS
jgi:hypothetical protein